jgi:hypothetical protein
MPVIDRAELRVRSESVGRLSGLNLLAPGPNRLEANHDGRRDCELLIDRIRITSKKLPCPVGRP